MSKNCENSIIRSVNFDLTATTTFAVIKVFEKTKLKRRDIYFTIISKKEGENPGVVHLIFEVYFGAIRERYNCIVFNHTFTNLTTRNEQVLGQHLLKDINFSDVIFCRHRNDINVRLEFTEVLDKK